MSEELPAAPERIALMNERVQEVLRLVRRHDPEPACWMEEDASASYCWECAQHARAKELGLAAPLREPEPQYRWARTEAQEAEWKAWESFREGIGGGYWGQGESDNCEHCDTCGKQLAYTLTDYGAREEIDSWTRCVIRAVGDGWHPEASYALDRVHINLGWSGAPAWMVEGVIAIATAALATTA